MNVSIGERWEGFVERIVKSGRYGSASEVVREGLRLVEEREAKLAALREKIDASIAGGGEVSDDELDAAIAKAVEQRAYSPEGQACQRFLISIGRRSGFDGKTISARPSQSAIAASSSEIASMASEPGRAAQDAPHGRATVPPGGRPSGRAEQ